MRLSALPYQHMHLCPPLESTQSLLSLVGIVLGKIAVSSISSRHESPQSWRLLHAAPAWVRQHSTWYYCLAWLVFAVATGLLVYAEVAFVAIPWWRWFAIMTLSWWLPGFLLIWRWSPTALDWPTAIVMGLGLGWGWQIGLILLLHWLPGPLSYSLFLTTYASGALLLLLLCWHKPLHLHAVDKRTVGWLLLLLLIALLLRLPALGAHEFHQDETHLLRRANEALRGDDEALARHTKGIGEIASVMVAYRALHTVNEQTARFPFALASVGSILALGLLGLRLCNGRVGFAAGLLFALNGFAIGLSRIAQYQGAVLLFSVLTLLAMWEFSRRADLRWLAFALLYAAFGLVMHYEFLLNGLPLLLLFVLGWRRTIQKGPILRTLLWVGGAAIALVAATYLPLLMNPYFATTQSYLATRLDDFHANNLTFFVDMATLYNSTYFAVGLVLLVVGGIALGWRAYRQPIWLLTLWFLPTLILYLAIVQYPGTHFYFMMPSWSLLAAVALVLLDERLQQIDWRILWGWRMVLLLWIAVSTLYLYLLFFRQSPAYLVNYPETRVPFYWAPYGDQIPQKPRFGFPIQEGWKTLGVLAEWGYFGKTYASNERSDALRWYLRGYDRVALTDHPDFIFVAQHVQERDPTFDELYLEESTYQRVGEVQVTGQPRIVIWAHAPLAGGYLVYDAERFAQAFDEAVPALNEWMQTPTQVMNETLDTAITLKAVTRNHVRLAAGQVLHLALWWRVEQRLHTDYKLFVHVANKQGYPLAQWDGMPGQNTQRTTTWPAGKIFEDHVLISLPDDMPVGEYDILVGFYNPVTGKRLGEHAIDMMTIKVHT